MVADTENKDDFVMWRELMQELAAGKTVEISCESERVSVRRERQVVKRAAKSGLLVEVLHEENVLRVEPRGGEMRSERSAGPRLASRDEKRRERNERREGLRTERGADRK
jgi:hypothetical protein